jgi:hypothetical protein
LPQDTFINEVGSALDGPFRAIALKPTVSNLLTLCLL